MKNPFYIREIPIDGPFCNRENELKEITQHAFNSMNVVLYSHRRFGKTSLAKRVMERVHKKGMIPIYVDFVGVTGVDDIAGRLAAKVYEYTKESESIFNKARKFLSMWQPVIKPDEESGIKIIVERVGPARTDSLLDETLKSLGEFSRSQKKGFYVVLDEFQEITNLPDSLNIEGRMRSQIQQHRNISYLFIGSRRRVLADMFRKKDRAFYQSALLYELKPINVDAFAKFVDSEFSSRKKICSYDIALKIVNLTRGYPYYTQKLAYFTFENSTKWISTFDITEAFENLIASEKPLFEVMAQSLSNQQMSLLIALSHEPTETPYSASYMARHNLGSIGGVQGALKRLLDLDYIEREDQWYIVVDPIFSIWLQKL